MSSEVKDLRVRRTRESIEAALVGLLSGKSLDSIKVGDITRRARVNRTTFYRHYRDKYQVAEGVLSRAIDALEAAASAPGASRARFTIDEVPEPWVRFFEQLEANQALCRAMLHSAGGAWLQVRLRQQVEQLLLRSVAGASPGRGGLSRARAVPREVAVAFAATQFIGIAIWWIDGGGRYSARQIATWLRQFFLHGYLGVS